MLVQWLRYTIGVPIEWLAQFPKSADSNSYLGKPALKLQALVNLLGVVMRVMVSTGANIIATRIMPFQ